MRSPHGYATIIGDPAHGFGMVEHDAVTCIHCGGVSMTRSATSGRLEVMVFRADGSHYFKEAGFCRSCFQPICPKCDGRGCSNRFARMEQLERGAA